MRQAHRHVEICRAGREASVEDRHDETRVDRIEHMRRAVLADEGCHGLGARCIHLRGGEAIVAQLVHDRLRAPRIVVSEDKLLEETSTDGDPGRRRADAPGADDEDAHARLLTGR